MNVSIEISMYPLADDYIPPIQAFIERLNRHSDLKVLTNTMSTQVFGPYAETLRIVAEAMQAQHRETPKASFVIKVLNGDLRPE
ncbi:MAG: thiamine-binding protein [Xanthomonadales bacterium]|nr:thiamine-binding protein [Xanthomonadales bacterium]